MPFLGNADKLKVYPIAARDSIPLRGDLVLHRIGARHRMQGGNAPAAGVWNKAGGGALAISHKAGGTKAA
jgi:hypothetical protein